MDLVRSLADAGVPLAVVTSGQRPYAEGLLAELGIRDLLDIVVTAGDVVTGKPHPEGYLAAARDLDVPPQETIGFEDAPAGVAAVKAAGMTCVGVITTQPAGALADADHVVADFKEVDVVPGPALRVRRPSPGYSEKECAVTERNVKIESRVGLHARPPRCSSRPRRRPRWT